VCYDKSNIKTVFTQEDLVFTRKYKHKHYRMGIRAVLDRDYDHNLL